LKISGLQVLGKTNNKEEKETKKQHRTNKEECVYVDFVCCFRSNKEQLYACVYVLFRCLLSCFFLRNNRQRAHRKQRKSLRTSGFKEGVSELQASGQFGVWFKKKKRKTKKKFKDGV